ncbi:hypothetical protein AB4084_30335, partial [Lysobacter sp. 2RAB21]
LSAIFPSPPAAACRADATPPALHEPGSQTRQTAADSFADMAKIYSAATPALLDANPRRHDQL